MRENNSSIDVERLGKEILCLFMWEMETRFNICDRDWSFIGVMNDLFLGSSYLLVIHMGDERLFLGYEFDNGRS